SYQTWTTLTKIVSLSAGQQVMKIVMDKEGDWDVGNINYIRVTPATTQTPATILPPTTAPTPAPILPPAPIVIVSGAFYVATNGNDANPGTEAQPWRTIQKAASTLTAGQTVYVKAGTYNEQITVQNSGSAGKYITFMSYPGQTATVDGTGNIGMRNSRDGGLIQIWGKSYINVIGFKIINSEYAGLYVNTPGNDDNQKWSNIRFEGNTIQDTWGSGILALNNAPSYTKNLVVTGNSIIRPEQGGDAMAHEDISFVGKIDGFEFSNNFLTGGRTVGGFTVKDGPMNGKIFGNTITDSDFSGIYICGSPDFGTGGSVSNIDIYNNKIYKMRNVGTDSSGINVATENTGSVRDIRIYNNLIYDNPGTAFRIASYGASTGSMQRVTFTSNTLYNNGVGNSNRGGISLEYEPATETVIRNNIIYANNGFSIRNSDSDALIANNLETNPSFINPSAGNFHLNSGSSAIDKGSSVQFVSSLDFDGKSRPLGAGYDIGAFEYKP
ncbi:MAG: right-handed parallel beta-helix repeat-containing protein, partial [Candidatus Methanoperedens sp.]